MDLTTVVMPGAQSLVTAILTESWGQTRTAIAKLWARKHPAPGTSTSPSADPTPAAIEQAGHELDAARTQAIELAGNGSESDRAARMRLYWAGYLAGQLTARPELADALAQLPALLAPAAPTSQTSNFRNDFSGTAQGTVIQIGNIQGKTTFGR
jgi:hypothetical protein